LRKKANEISEMQIIGDVEGMDVLLVDDIVDTAGTITKAADLMIRNGARSVKAIASHAVMSDPATERVENSNLAEILFTDSIPYNKESSKVTILSVADIFADAIRRVCSNESISSLYVL
jgi:ribose-phosphate pyrophosphokinase